MIYFSVFFLLILLRLACSGKRKLLLEISPLVYFLLFLFVAFRYEVGCDWPTYREWYANFGEVGLGMELTFMNPTYWGIMKAMKSLDFSFPWLNVIYASIFFTTSWIFIRRQPDPLAVIILMFPLLIMNMPMSALRQAAAIGIIMVAYLAFIDKKLTKYIVLTILATLFHSSALIFVVLIPFVKGEVDYKKLVTGGLLALPGIIALALSDLGQLAALRYVDTGYEAYGAIYRVGLLAISSLIFLLFFRKQWLKKYPKEYSLMMVGSTMMLVCFLSLSVSTIIGDRFAYYLIPLQAAFFARIPYMEIKNWKSLWVATPYAMNLALFSVWILLSGFFQTCYLPYNTWILGQPDSRGDYYEFWEGDYGGIYD